MSLSQQMLEKARAVAAGEATAEELRPLVEQVAAATAHAQARFETDAAGNPEIYEESAARVREAMREFHARVVAMRDALGDPAALGRLADEAAGYAGSIRAAQDQHEATVTRGGVTPFPFVNRLLVHVKALEHDQADPQHALRLLSDMPAWLDEVMKQVMEAPGFGVSSQGAVVVEEMRAAGVGLCEALRSGGDRLGAAAFMRETLEKGAERLQRVLGKKVESDLVEGPTPIAVINVVIRAADAMRRGTIGREGLREVVERALQASQAMGEGGDPTVGEALQATREALQQVADADVEGLPARVSELEAAAQNLAMFLVVTTHPSYDEDEDEDEGLNFVTGAQGASGGGLPVLLDSLLQVGGMYIEGMAAQQDVLDGVDQLDLVIQRTADTAARAREATERLQIIQECLDLLCEAGDCMRTVAATQDAYALRNAESLMRQASERLAVAQGMKD
jgi:hypothetical protein